MRALLPFEPNEYRKDFANGEELDGFEQALEAADEIVALPGNRSDLQNAYVLVGQSLVGTADILIAIWDGEQGKGPGGTAHVVEMALEKAVPVIHINVDHESDMVRVRALVAGDATAPFEASLHDPELYSQLLRGVFRLGHGPTPDPRTELTAVQPADG